MSSITAKVFLSGQANPVRSISVASLNPEQSLLQLAQTVCSDLMSADHNIVKVSTEQEGHEVEVQNLAAKKIQDILPESTASGSTLNLLITLGRKDEIAPSSSQPGPSNQQTSVQSRGKPLLLKVIGTLARFVITIEVINLVSGALYQLKKRRVYGSNHWAGMTTDTSTSDDSGSGSGSHAGSGDAMELLVDYVRGRADLDDLQDVSTEAFQDAVRHVDTDILEEMGVGPDEASRQEAREALDSLAQTLEKRRAASSRTASSRSQKDKGGQEAEGSTSVPVRSARLYGPSSRAAGGPAGEEGLPSGRSSRSPGGHAAAGPAEELGGPK